MADYRRARSDVAGCPTQKAPKKKKKKKKKPTFPERSGEYSMSPTCGESRGLFRGELQVDGKETRVVALGRLAVRREYGTMLIIAVSRIEDNRAPLAGTPSSDDR